MATLIVSRIQKDLKAVPELPANMNSRDSFETDIWKEQSSHFKYKPFISTSATEINRQENRSLINEVYFSRSITLAYLRNFELTTQYISLKLNLKSSRTI